MSEPRDKFRFIRFRASDGRELLEKLKYLPGTLRNSRDWRRFWELAERDELEQCLRPFREEFPRSFNFFN